MLADMLQTGYEAPVSTGAVMSAESDQGFSDLLARLYRGIAAEPPWQDFLEDLARWMGAAYATLIITTPGKRLPATFITPGANPAVSAAYAESLFADDPFRGLPDGEVVSYAEFMSAHPPEAFSAYRRAMAEVGFDVVLGVDLHFGAGKQARRDAGRYEARLRISRHSTQPDFARADRDRLRLIVPHLRIAVGLFERLQFAGAQHGVFHSAAQGLGIGLILLDRNRAIVSSNALADRILNEDEGLSSRGGELLLASPIHQRLIADLLAGSAPVTPLPRFRIERPNHGDLVVTARVLDLRAIHAGTGALALFLSHPEPETAADPEAIRTLLGLTPAEARLAAAMARGHNLVSAARQLGIAHNTAKVQLRAIFAKTGVNRQARLVALIGSLNS